MNHYNTLCQALLVESSKQNLWGRERDTLDVRLIYILYKTPGARKRFKIFTQI
jgi:hypothetical protein